MMRRSLPTLLVSLFLLTSCGGSGGGSGSSTTTTTPVATVLPNSLAVTVDGGPAVLTSANDLAANTLYATITVCTPGSTTACRTIDHVQVDTGSTGLRLIASTLSGATPTTVIEPNSGRPLLECAQFADGYSWGSVATVDVTLGSRKISSVPINVIGDPAAGTAPSTCASGPAENTVADFGANGILGIGNFIQDCGPACATTAIAGTYYTCPTTAGGSSCTATAVALSRQLPNPVTLLTADNNGVVIQLPAVASPGVTTISGTLFFGVATQSDNVLVSGAHVLTLDNQGTLTATLGGATYTGSFIDSGSNGYFFASNIPLCTDATYFYCPVTSSNTPTSVSETVIATGSNAASATITFNVDNADQIFNSANTAFPGLAGPSGSLLNGTAGVVDIGLPFFFGRTVAVVIENSTALGVTGPAVAF
jgi:hypothetical protein